MSSGLPLSIKGEDNLAKLRLHDNQEEPTLKRGATASEQVQGWECPAKYREETKVCETRAHLGSCSKSQRQDLQCPVK